MWPHEISEDTKKAWVLSCLPPSSKHTHTHTHTHYCSQTCIARLRSDCNLSTYKIGFSDIKKSLIGQHILCILSVLGKCQGLRRGCGNQPIRHAVSSLFISVCTHPSMTEGLLNAQESHRHSTQHVLISNNMSLN